MSDTENIELTDVDITILNAARGILRQHSDIKAGQATSSQIRAAVVAEHAEDALFKFLNTYSSYMHREMTHEQLHMTAAPVVAR